MFRLVAATIFLVSVSAAAAAQEAIQPDYDMARRSLDEIRSASAPRFQASVWHTQDIQPFRRTRSEAAFTPFSDPLTRWNLSAVADLLKDPRGRDERQEFKVMSRTYNDPPESPPLGTHGLAMPGQSIGESIQRGSIAGLSNTAAFRSNVGVLNPQPYAITVRFELFNGDGVLIAQHSRDFAPLEFFQANTIFTFLDVGTEVDNAYVRVSSTQGSFFAYGSVVDQKSADGTIVPVVGD